MYTHSNLRVIALSAVFGLLAVSASRAKSANEDATTYQINAAHDGHVDFAAGFNAPLVRAWSFNTGDNYGSYPVIGNGMLFFVGNGNDAFALDLATGARVWEHLLPTGTNSPTYDNGTAAFFNASGAVTGLKARTGKQRWSVSLSGNQNESSYPIAVDGAFIVAGYSLTSIDAATGAVNWSNSLNNYSDTVTYGDNGLYAGIGCDYTKYSRNGNVVWTSSGDCNGYQDNVAYFGKKLYVADYEYNTNLVLSTKDGSQTGFFPGDTLPVFFTSNKRSYELVTSNGRLYCLDLKTGNVVWSFQNSEGSGMPIVVNGHPIVASYTTLYMLDGTSGAPLWSDNVGGSISYITAGDGVLAVTAGGTVVVYKPQ